MTKLVFPIRSLKKNHLLKNKNIRYWMIVCRTTILSYKRQIRLNNSSFVEVSYTKCTRSFTKCVLMRNNAYFSAVEQSQLSSV